jgi:methylthioribose-1-phosphate isomerase
MKPVLPGKEDRAAPTPSVADEELPLLMDLERNVYLEGGRLVMVDRRRLPGEIVRIVCETAEDVARAIEGMAVQGAGDIAVTAGYGLYLESLRLGKEDRGGLERAARRLKATRPTGYHLAALLDRMLERIDEDPGDPPAVIRRSLERALRRQREISVETGRFGETLLESGDTILTHCFAGAGLLHMLRFAREKGKDIRVFCTETRPYLQGARLTAWSVSSLGLETVLITDGMAAHFLSRGEIRKVFTAADRIALDGSVANKVGTLALAIAAHRYGVPFYILGYGGPDRRTGKGADIPIEERDPGEVLRFQGIPITGPLVKARYPAFDITPPELVTAVVTASGILYRKEG